VGTYISSYAVDLGRVARAWGSHDTRLVNRAIAGARCDRNAASFAEEIAEGAPRLDEAIRELVDGKITKRRYGFQYVYALEALCRALGKQVGDELKIGRWIELIIDPRLKKVKARGFERLFHIDVIALPVKLPKPSSYPLASSMTRAEVKIARDAFERLARLVDEEDPKVDVRDTIDYVLAEVRARLGGAARRRSGLVHFLY
jgi:hypothetical protein